jgi:ATP-dependent Clp protease ATP-binding subunit ClpC
VNGKNDDIILFIDEIHTIVGAGGATGSLDALTCLSPL